MDAPRTFILDIKSALNRYSTQLLLAIFTFSLLVIFAIGPRISSYWSPYDDGYYVHTAQRLVSGEVLTRDIQTRHAGYIHFVNAAALWLFGSDLLSTRMPLLLMIAFSAWLAFMLFKDHGPLSLMTGITTAVIFNAFMAPTPNAHWYCFPITLWIAILLHECREHLFKKTLLIGFLIGLLFGFRQLTGMLVGMASLTWLLATTCTDDRDGIPKKHFGRSISMLNLLLVSVYVFHFYNGTFNFIIIGLWSFLSLIWAIERCSIEFKKAVHIIILLMSGSFLGLLPLIIYHTCYGSLWLFLDDTIFRAGSMTNLEYLRDSDFAVYVRAGIHYLQNAHNISEFQVALFWIILPLTPLLAGLSFLRAVKFNRAIPPVMFIALQYALVADVYRMHFFLYYILGLTLLSLIYIELGTRLRIPVCILCLWLSGVAAYYHLGAGVYRTIWTGERPDLVVSELPHISVRMDQLLSQRYTKLREIIQSNSKLNSPVLSLPYAPEVYIVSDRINPFRFSCGADGVQNAQDVMQIKQKVLSLLPMLFIYDPKSKYNTPLQTELATWMKENGDQIGESDGFEVYSLHKRDADA